MGLVEQNFDIQFVKDLTNLISKIKENRSKFLDYIKKLQETNYEKDFLKEIAHFDEVIRNEFSNKANYLKSKQDCFKDLKSKFKDYYESILKIYENDYINRMKEYSQELEYLIDNINSESELQKLDSSSSSNKKSTNDESFGDEKRSSFNIIEGYRTYNEYKNKSTFNSDDIFKSIEINFNCSVCPIENPQKATIFCDICNQLFCNSCYEIIEKYDNKDNKCMHNIQNIANMKEKSKKGKIFFLNSLIIFLKRIILKSNYLLDNQSQEIKFIENGDNESKINFIKKKLFEYPFIKDSNNINNSTEINFLKSINNILVNNYEIKNEDINSYNISIIHEDLMSSLENIFMGKKNRKKNSDFQIKELVKQQQDIDDDEDVEEDDITDEKNIIKEPKKKGFK